MSRSEQTWCAAMKIELEISDVFVREAEMLAERLSSDREHVTRDDVLVLAIGSGLNAIAIDVINELTESERREDLRNLGR
jgi:hypothetical protein